MTDSSRTKLKGLAAGAAFSALIILLALAGTFRRAELKACDLLFRLRGGRDTAGKIVIAGLDESTRRTLGRKWNRADLARAINTLSAGGAELICLDILLVSPKDEQNDRLLAEAVWNANNVILSNDLSEASQITPYELFRRGEIGEGGVGVFPDEDSVVRRMGPPMLGYDRESESWTVRTMPLPLETAYRYYYFDPPPVDLSEEGFIAFGDRRVPNPEGGMLINYPGGHGTFPYVSFGELVSGETDMDFRDRIVLIGSFSALEHDYYPVPFSSAAFEETSGPVKKKGKRYMYGVEIHAAALDTILTEKYITKAGVPAAPAILAALALAAVLLFYPSETKPLVSALLFTVLTVSYFSAAFYLFAAKGLWIPLVPAFGLIAGNFVTGTLYRRYVDLREKRRIMGMFGKYVSPNIAGRLVEDPSLVKLCGRKKRLTVFFSDIRGFTPLSETMDPEEISALLNDYFTEMTAILFKYEGTLDKFMGDALMAFFGDPVYFEDHAVRTVKMALEMQDAVDELNEKWSGENRPGFDIGIGINTGEVTVGNHGSTEFFDYTVLGDDVNLAGRLESNAKKGQILISESTYEEIKDAVFKINKLKPVKVKGKSEPVRVYEVVKE